MSSNNTCAMYSSPQCKLTEITSPVTLSVVRPTRTIFSIFTMRFAVIIHHAQNRKDHLAASTCTLYHTRDHQQEHPDHPTIAKSKPLHLQEMVFELAYYPRDGSYRS